MGQGHFRGHLGQHVRVCGSKRSARGREHQSLHQGQIGQIRAAQGLKKRVVLGIDRQNHRARNLRQLPDAVPGQNKGLLVGQGHDLAGGHGGQRRQQAGRAHDGRKHEIGLGRRGQGGIARRAGQDVRLIPLRQQLGQGNGPGCVEHGQHRRPEPGGLFGQQAHIGRPGQAGHDIAVGMLGHDLEGADADGARGPEQDHPARPAGPGNVKGRDIARPGGAGARGRYGRRTGCGRIGHASRRVLAGSAPPDGAMP